ncbi:MAG: LysM peptidoglycan-binding domain-containing protein [Planctomycetota bacterium]|nr:MAG: LysM peptidoglycan-binding domain-containing protein [Planctomycetota bacterium]
MKVILLLPLSLAGLAATSPLGLWQEPNPFKDAPEATPAPKVAGGGGGVAAVPGAAGTALATNSLSSALAQAPATPPSPVGSPQRWRMVQVQAGDSLQSLSRKHLGTTKHWQAIQEINGLKNPKQLKVGQWLRLPLHTQPRGLVQEPNSKQKAEQAARREALESRVIEIELRRQLADLEHKRQTLKLHRQEALHKLDRETEMAMQHLERNRLDEERLRAELNRSIAEQVELDHRINDLRRSLDAASLRLSEKHPEVQNLKAQLESTLAQERETEEALNGGWRRLEKLQKELHHRQNSLLAERDDRMHALLMELEAAEISLNEQAMELELRAQQKQMALEAEALAALGYVQAMDNHQDPALGGIGRRLPTAAPPPELPVEPAAPLPPQAPKTPRTPKTPLKALGYAGVSVPVDPRLPQAQPPLLEDIYRVVIEMQAELRHLHEDVKELRDRLDADRLPAGERLR